MDDGLELRGLRLAQGSFRLSADLSVARGSVVAVMGPSGGGKSTLLAAIAGFLVPLAGQVIWDRQDITHRAPAARPVAMLFQDGNLFPHLTVAQNIGLGLRPSLRLTQAESAKVESVLAQVGLGGMGARRPAELSGGQQSRAALARVLISARDVVLLDEPFAALGPALRGEMLDLSAQVLRGAGRTVLMVTHAPEDAARIADQIIVVDGGRAAPPVATAAILADPPSGLRDYLGGQP